MGNFRDLIIYHKAFELTMDIFAISKSFPPEERFSLTDQIRRASRSTCGSIAEAYRKRRYPKHWVSKLTDVDMENAETEVWSDVALACRYISAKKHAYWIGLADEIARLSNYMQNHPEKFR